MRLDNPSRLAALVLLGGFLISVPACHKSGGNAPAAAGGATVRGKVLHNGAAIPYGVVLFYNADKGMDPHSGNMAPSAYAKINPDGTYEATNVPVGFTMVAVATDPDIDIALLMRPGLPGGGPEGGRAGGPPGGMAGAAPGGPPGGAPPGPPGRGGAPQGGPPSGGPPGGSAAGMPNKPAGPADGPAAGNLGGRRGGRGGAPGEKARENPWAHGLTDDQKKLLKELHTRYGVPGRSPLALEVKEGEQTYDIPLS